MENLTHMVITIARALVDAPEAVSIREIGGNSVCIMELTVAKPDMGKIIGKQGQNVGAIRTILSAVSAKTKKHTLLEIVENR